MYKLVYETFGQKTKSFDFENLPSIEEIHHKTGCLLDSNVYEKLTTNGYVGIIVGFFELTNFKIPTVAQLQEAWKDWVKVFSCGSIRFGQYIFNTYGYEVGNSYNEVSACKAYRIIFESITESLDEVVDGSIHQ